MNRFVWLLMFSAALVLSGCTSSAYKEAVASGNAAIEAGNYEKAFNEYSIALAEKETEEAKTVLDFLQLMEEAAFAFEENDFAASMKKYQEIIDTENDGIEIILVIQKTAKEQWTQAQTASEVYAGMTDHMEKGKTELEAKRFEEAIRLFELVSAQKDWDASAFQVLREQAISLTEEAREEKQRYAAAQELDKQLQQATLLLQEEKIDEAIELFAEVSKQQPETVNEDTKAIVGAAQEQLQKAVAKKQKIEKQEQLEKEEKAVTEQAQAEPVALTVDEAKELAADYAGREALKNQNVHLDYDHNRENGEYVFRMYEFVVDNVEAREGHMVTWGFYTVNPITKDVAKLTY